MQLYAAHVLGLRGAEHWEAEDLGAAVSLPEAPVGIAVADGLTLLQAALCVDPAQGPGAADARALLQGLELLGPDAELHYDAHGFLEQVVGLEPAAVRALLADESDRKVFAGVTLSLDPPLYGRLREQSLRDPRVVTALGRDPSLGIKVGWLLTKDLAAASITVLDVRVGDLSFPVNSTDRPAWMTGLLREIGGRFGRVGGLGGADDLAASLEEAALSPEPSVRAAYRRLAGVTAEPPFDLGALELVRSGGRTTVAFGDALRRARQLGPVALRQLSIAAAAILGAPDVLVVDEPVGEGLRGWLVGCTEGEEATLEQVLFVGEAS